MDIKSDFLEYIKTLGSVALNAPMADFTSFACGGTADILIIPNSAQVLAELFKELYNTDLRLTVIGGGSNLLVGDRGIRGAVVAIREHVGNIGVIEIADGLIYADAMAKKSRFIDFCLKNGFGGIDFMAGIPGCIGGGVAMNAGANAGNFSGILKRVACVDRKGEAFTVNAEPSMSDYRGFSAGEGVFVAGAFFELSTKGADEAAKLVQDALAQRALKHPLEYPSAGSVFKNPASAPAWQLVEAVGFRGRGVGGAMVSGKHSNFIINTGGARSSDIRALVELIQDAVMKKFSVKLEPEIRMIGEF